MTHRAPASSVDRVDLVGRVPPSARTTHAEGGTSHAEPDADGVLHRVLTPSASLVLALQSARGFPCVTLLAATTPGETMTHRDADHLRELADQALVRLQQTGHAGRGTQPRTP